MTTSRTDRPEWRDFCKQAAVNMNGFRQAPELNDVLGVSRELGRKYRLALDLPPGYDDDPLFCRYLHQAHELRRRFGLAGKRIVEIGGGYGGLAAVVAAECDAYEIVDLPEARRLQNAYLARQEIQLTTVGGPFDLLVSCYAFSELVPEVQREYAAAYLARADAGYMICNFLGGSLSPAQLLALAPKGARYEAERPQSHPDNLVMIWGDK